MPRLATPAAPPTTHCPFHHGLATECPPLDPELGDLIPDLLARGVNIQLVPAPRRVEHCEHCPAPAIAYVCYRAPSEALPDGFVYRPPLCAGHLWDAVICKLWVGSQCWIEVPTVGLSEARDG